jgi:hypothetical protein
MKLKSYCCEYLGRHLSVKTVHSVLEQATIFRFIFLYKYDLVKTPLRKQAGLKKKAIQTGVP